MLIVPHPKLQCVIEGAVPYLGMFLTMMARLENKMKDHIHVSEHGAVEQALGREGPLLTLEI